MEKYTKRDWISLMRYSLIITIVHALLIGLLYDWNFLSWYNVKIKFISQNITFSLPRMFDVLSIPLIWVLWRVFFDKENETLKSILQITLGFGFACYLFRSEIDTGILIGSFTSLLLGIKVAVSIMARTILVVMVLIFIKFLLLLIPPVKRNYKKIKDWLNAKEVH